MALKTHLAFALGALCARAAATCDDPEPDEPSAPGIETVSFSGNGCPQGSVNGNFTADGSVALSEFSTEVSSTASAMERTKNCQMHIQFSESNSPDWQLSVMDVNLKGYLVLEKGAAATTYVTAFWTADASNTVESKHSITNTEDLPKTEFVSITQSVSDLWSPCNASYPGILNVNVRMAMAAEAKDNGDMAYGSFGKFELPASNFSYPVQQGLNFKWQRCNATAGASKRSVSKLRIQ